jgi:hypothetical protein
MARVRKAVDFQHEHALLEKAKRQIAELDIEKLEARLLDAADVEEMNETHLHAWPLVLLPMVERIAPRVLGQSIATVASVIRDEVYDTLTALSKMTYEQLQAMLK